MVLTLDIPLPFPSTAILESNTLANVCVLILELLLSLLGLWLVQKIASFEAKFYLICMFPEVCSSLSLTSHRSIYVVVQNKTS